MAKSDSFFIRATHTFGVAGTTNYTETEIPLGAYVDALGKSVLRIHNIEYEISTLDGKSPTLAANTGANCAWAVTTRSEASATSVPTLNNRSVIAKGMLWARNPDAAQNAPSQVYSDSIAPQHFTDGFLVAVENIFLGGERDDSWELAEELEVNIMMECTVETLTQSAAMALALSQQ